MSIDADDPAALARWWSELLRWRITFEEPDEVAVEPPVGSREAGLVPELLFVKVPDTAAQRRRADHLFSTTPANRLEAVTEVDSTAEQRALEKAGFVREGVMRGRGFVRGGWRDGVLYARLRTDPAP